MASRVIEIGRTDGLTMDSDRGISVNTLNAHRLLALAERESGPAVQRDLMRRLFAAHFAEGRDVGDPAALAAIAADVGMDADTTHKYLESEQGTREVREEIAAAQRLGVTAVPTYIFDDRYVVEGAQPSELFLQALNTVAEQSSASDLPVTS
jgi:predicted DsbA family dithiol-disulfide isomerase